MKHALRILWLLMFSCVVALGADVPKLNGYRINDHANLLSEDQRTALESKLEAYEKETSNQFALLTVESLEGDTPQEFANRTFREWGLGQKEKDNGILVLFSLGDRKLRIEVGSGLEGAVPDATASQIYQEMAKLTKQNKYYEGFDLGFNSLISATKGEYTSDAYASSMAGGKLMIGVVLAILLVVIGACSQTYGAAGIAICIGLLYGVFGFGTFGIVVLCIIVALVVCGIGMAIGSAASSGGYGQSSGGSLFDGLGSSSSSYGSNNTSTGGFSGGGGDSGGGGAGGDA